MKSEVVKQSAKQQVEKVQDSLSQALESARNGLKKVPTPVWYVAGGFAIYYFGIRPIARDVGSLFNFTEGNQDFQEKAGEIVSSPAADGSRPSISVNEAKSIADQQLRAMNRPGTSTKALFDSLRGINGADLRLVYAAFGRVWYDPILGVQGGKLFEWAGNRELDLLAWYSHELSASEMAQMRQVWAKSGLAFGRGLNDVQSFKFLS